MKCFRYILLFLFPFTLHAQSQYDQLLVQASQAANASTQTPSNVLQGKQFDFVIRMDTFHEYNKYISDSMHYYEIYAVEIYQKGAKTYTKQDPKFLQRYVQERVQLELWRYDKVPAQLLDANFDGYEDLEVLHFPGMYWNEYQYYLYDPKHQNFKQDTFLIQLTDPTFHPVGKYVHYSYHIGLSEFGHAVYQWQNDQLILIGEEREYESFMDTSGMFTTYSAKRVNGKMVEMPYPAAPDTGVFYGMGPCLEHTRMKKCDLFERSTR